MNKYEKMITDAVLFTGDKALEEFEFNEVEICMNDTADMCDEEYFMDYLFLDFPEVIALVEKNENNEWKIKDFVVGYVEDCIDWKTEVVSAWIAEELGLIEDVIEFSRQTIDSYNPSKRSFFIHGSDKYYGFALHFKEDLLNEAANSSNAEVIR